MNMRTKFEVLSFTHSWDNKGYSKNWEVPGYAYVPFSPKFLTGFCYVSWTLWIYLPNLKFVALPVPEIITIAVLGWDCKCKPPILGAAVGDRGGTVRKNIGEFLQALHSNFSSIFTRFKDIAAVVLQHTTFPHPTSSLPQISHVPLGVGGWPLEYEERMWWANCLCN